MAEISDPIRALARRPGGSLALLTGAEGGFPRNLGAMMALWPDGRRVGRLGAGCVDADIAAHLGRPERVTILNYGTNGPIDLPLPCGGSITVALVQKVEAGWVADVLADRKARRTGQWGIDLVSGQISREGAGFALTLQPSCRIQCYGDGDEATALALLTNALGIDFAHPGDGIDAQTAVVTLFHDHDKELPILKAALASPAFYVGALGSTRAQAARIAALQAAGVPAADLARLHGPIGVVAQVREPKLLALSVMTQILGLYEDRFK